MCTHTQHTHTRTCTRTHTQPHTHTHRVQLHFSFFLFSGGQYTPCSVDQQGAFVMKLSELPPDKVHFWCSISVWAFHHNSFSFWGGWGVGVNPLLQDMKLFFIGRVQNSIQNGQSLSKLDLCEGGSFSPTIFKSDIEVNVYHISCFIFVCPFVALSKANFLPKIRTLFCLVHIKTRSFLTSCLL